MLLALLAWIGGTVWLLNMATRTERGLWELRKRRPATIDRNRNQRGRGSFPRRLA